MRIFPFPRRHRTLWIVAAVLGVSAWGSWLAATGRAIDYGGGFAHFPASSAAAPAPDAPPVSRAPAAGVTAPAAVLSSRAAASAEPEPLVADPPSRKAGASERPSVVAGPVSSRPVLAGMTDPVVFTRDLAGVVLSYGSGEEPSARADTVLAVAALPRLGSPSELAADLGRFAPTPTLVASGATVTFTPDSVAVSEWAAARIAQLRLPAGSFAIDVTGNQIVTVPGHAPVSVAVTLGVTGACPPALSQCEVDRIFPRSIVQEFGS